jgi:hypothetical protein
VSAADADPPTESVTPELSAWLDRLEPHGMGNPRPLFHARLRAASAFRPLGATGARGWIRRGDGGRAVDEAEDLPCISWAPGILADVRRGESVDAQFRLRRSRGGGPEVEIVGARPPGFLEPPSREEAGAVVGAGTANGDLG